MIRALLLCLIASPAAARDLPFAKGDHLLQRATLEADTCALIPNSLTQSEWACFVIGRITPTNLDLRLQAGFFDLQMPPWPGEKPQTAWATVGTSSSMSSSEGLFLPCPTPDPTGYTTVFLDSCDIARLYQPVTDCKGRQLPPD